MKNTITILMILLVIRAFPQSQEVLDKIESAKIALITQRLDSITGTSGKVLANISGIL